MDSTGIYNTYHQPIYFACLRILNSREEAQECMQDAFVKLFSKKSPVFVNDAALFSWLRKVAVRGAIDRLRSLDFRMDVQSQCIEKKEVMEKEDQDDFFSSNSSQEEMQRKVSDVKQAIAQMPSGYRTVLSLYLFDGYDFDEISDITRLKPSSVRSQYSRAREQLQSNLSKKWTL